jgi:HK97 family phage major capsid protein
MFEEIKEWSAEQIEERSAAIKNEIENADEVKLDELNNELNAIEERKKVIEMETRKESMKAVAEGAGVVISKVEEKKEERTLESVRSSAAYEDAFAEYLKSGDDRECRALMTDLVSGGSVPIPTVIDEYINTAWENARILSRVRRTSIKGTAKYPFEYSATGAFAHTEGAEVAANTEESLVLGTVAIEPQMLKKWITVTDEVIALKGRAFLDYVWDEIEERIYELADATLIAAIKAAPASATTSAAGVRALTPAAIDASTIFQALAQLKNAATNPVAIMNKQTYFNQFMSLTDLQGRPIYDIVSANGRPTYYINGVEVIFDNTLATGTNAEIIVGDLRGAIANFPDGESIKFVNDPYSLAEQDKVKIVGKMYVGIGVVRDGFFCKVTVTPTP